jgi:Mce-associated membrane protein
MRRAATHETGDEQAVDQAVTRETAAEDTAVIPKITDDAVKDAPVRDAVEGAAVGKEAAPARPKPSGRRRPAAVPKPAPAESTAEMPKAPDVPGPDVPVGAGTRRNGWLVPAVLAVAAVLLGGLAAFFGVQWSNSSDSGSNVALTDSAATAEVSGQVTSAVNTIFSYNYTNMGKTQKAVQQLLTGSALCQYNELYKVVQQQAPSQKLVLTTTVQDKGVEMLQNDKARVLLLVQQHDTRATTNQQSDSQSMIAVNAVKQGSAWKISAIDTFNGNNQTNCKS